MYLPISHFDPAQSVARLVPAHTPSSYLQEEGGDEGSPGGLGQYSSIIGIVTAIVGNVLIALALNVQRYAHIRLHRERKYAKERAKQALRNAKNGGPRRGGYGALDEQDGRNSDGALAARDDADETDPLTQSFRTDGSRWSENSDDDDEMPKAPSTYLKSPYWWLGQILITVGECGNFLAYGFAPASIVSPLGVVALISNCVIAPILFKEHFRKRDFWGVVVAVAGAVTVVLSADTQETKLDPHAVWEHITSTGFEIYMGVTCGLIVLLMWLSPKYGNRTILIDLGLVGLFGKSNPGSAVQISLLTTIVRRLYCLVNQGHFVHAVIYILPSIYNPSHLCSGLHFARYSHHAGPLCQQGAAKIRLDASHTHTICGLYVVRHHWKCGAIPGL